MPRLTTLLDHAIAASIAAMLVFNVVVLAMQLSAAPVSVLA